MSESITPWFGAWPPRVRAESVIVEQSKHKSFWRKIFSLPNLILGSIGAVGILLLLFVSGFWHDLGTALVIAGLLGLIIDNYLRQRLAKDAVEAALGYVLPDPLKEEMRWVVGLKFLVIDHTAIYDIRFNRGKKTVSMSVEITRKIKNFTEAPQYLKPFLSIDEMGIEGKPSRIKEIRYRIEKNSWVYVDVSKIKATECTLGVEAQKKEKIPAGEWIEIMCKFHETKQINDVHFMVLRHATTKPNIIVHTDKGLEHREGFTHRIGQPEGDILPGTLLPYQSMHVRWWPSVQKDVVIG